MRDTNNKENKENNNIIIYLNLKNKYKKRMNDSKNFSDKLHVQKELKNDSEYLMLSEKEKNELFLEIMEER